MAGPTVNVTVPVGAPPVPETVAVYVTVRPYVVVPGATVAVVVDGVRTVRVKDRVAVEDRVAVSSSGVEESVTVMVTFDLLEVVGVPVIFPVEERERPLGKPVADHVYGG
jgi:hypothetical protein